MLGINVVAFQIRQDQNLKRNISLIKPECKLYPKLAADGGRGFALGCPKGISRLIMSFFVGGSADFKELTK